MSTNIYSVESDNGVRLDIFYEDNTKIKMNELLTARNLCYSAIDAINEMIDRQYPLRG